MKQLNYKEQLQLAQNTGISPTELFIAEEVDMIGIYTNAEFETVCALVYDTYMDTTDNSISYCSRAITRLFSKYNAEELWDMGAWERLDLYEEEF